METIALVSGGKDSFFSLLHSQRNGYTITALANLHPPANSPEDANSFMYQTVGYTVLPHYSTILNIPLYRRELTGKSVNQNLSYDTTAEDETEDLYELLKTIKEKHPNVKFVSSGAILSSYQRTRVESVCSRLGLTSLAWLWQRSQTKLLEEIAEVGLDARIIKVASGGLDEKWLNKNVASQDIREELEKVRVKFGGNVAGEGGEYETLVVGCKGWDRRIEFTKTEVVDEGGGVYRLAISESEVVECESEQVTPSKPVVLEDEYDLPPAGGTPTRREVANIPRTVLTAETTTFTANIHSKQLTLPEELDAIFSQASPSNMTNTLLLLRSMDLFPLVNPVYNKWISGLNPPSRVCIATDLPEGINVMLSTFSESYPRKALHVQSRSYWAPANVGPYSQAITVDGVATLAGQIGLIPETMKLHLEREAEMALQNMVRVGKQMGVGKYGYAGGIGYTTSSDPSHMQTLWESWFKSKEPSSSDFEPTPNLANFEDPPPLLIVQVAALPLGATSEFAGIGLDSTYGAQREESAEEHIVYFGPHTLRWGVEMKQMNRTCCTTLFCTPEANVTGLLEEFGVGAAIVPVLNVWWYSKRREAGVWSRSLSRRAIKA